MLEPSLLDPYMLEHSTLDLSGKNFHSKAIQFKQTSLCITENVSIASATY